MEPTEAAKGKEASPQGPSERVWPCQRLDSRLLALRPELGDFKESFTR